MLDEPAGRRNNVDAPNHDDAENKQPPPARVFLNGDGGLVVQHVGIKTTTTTTRQAMKKKGGKKLRQTTTTCCPPRLQHLLLHHHHHHHHHHNNNHHHQHHHHSAQTTRSARSHPPHSNHNNNNTNSVVSGGTGAALCGGSSSSSTAQSLQTTTSAEPAGFPQPAPVPTHHPKLGNNNGKKELLKSKAVRCERVVTPPGVKHDHHTSQNRNSRSHRSKHGTSGPSSAHTVKRKDASNPQKLPYSTLKTPLRSTDNVKIEEVSPTGHVNQEEGEKIYAGAKFSEPPSPSVLPKPPSHWVGGENTLQTGDQSREQMTVHLKSLLKVEGKA